MYLNENVATPETEIYFHGSSVFIFTFVEMEQIQVLK